MSMRVQQDDANRFEIATAEELEAENILLQAQIKDEQRRIRKRLAELDDKLAELRSSLVSDHSRFRNVEGTLYLVARDGSASKLKYNAIHSRGTANAPPNIEQDK